MRNIKIYKSNDLSKTDHPNVDKIFPLNSNNPDESLILEGTPLSQGQLNKKSKESTPVKRYNLRNRVPSVLKTTIEDSDDYVYVSPVKEVNDSNFDL